MKTCGITRHQEADFKRVVKEDRKAQQVFFQWAGRRGESMCVLSVSVPDVHKEECLPNCIFETTWGVQEVTSPLTPTNTSPQNL